MPSPDQLIERRDDLIDGHAQRVRQRRDVAAELDRWMSARHDDPCRIGGPGSANAHLRVGTG